MTDQIYWKYGQEGEESDENLAKVTTDRRKFSHPHPFRGFVWFVGFFHRLLVRGCLLLSWIQLG